MSNGRAEVEIKKAVNEASKYLEHTALEKQHGDIVVTITMFRGEPVKLTTSFCEHITRRSVNRYVVRK